MAVHFGTAGEMAKKQRTLLRAAESDDKKGDATSGCRKIATAMTKLEEYCDRSSKEKDKKAEKVMREVLALLQQSAGEPKEDNKEFSALKYTMDMLTGEVRKLKETVSARSPENSASVAKLSYRDALKTNTEANLAKAAQQSRFSVVVKLGKSTTTNEDTPMSLVRQANGALGSNAVKSITKLKSGDIKAHFLRAQDCSAASQDTEWVEKAWGKGMKISKRYNQVVVDGFSAERIRRMGESRLSDILSEENGVDIASVKIPRGQRFAARAVLPLYLYLESWEQANLLCARGVFWEAKAYLCSPFCGESRVERCFRCHRFGHRQTFCQREATCGFCSATHLEADCPKKKTGKAARCVNCGKAHPSWSKHCPTATGLVARAKEAFLKRPRFFQAPPQMPSLDTMTTARPAVVTEVTPTEALGETGGIMPQATAQPPPQPPKKRGRPRKTVAVQ